MRVRATLAVEENRRNGHDARGGGGGGRSAFPPPRRPSNKKRAADPVYIHLVRLGYTGTVPGLDNRSAAKQRPGCNAVVLNRHVTFFFLSYARGHWPVYSPVYYNNNKFNSTGKSKRENGDIITIVRPDNIMGNERRKI